MSRACGSLRPRSGITEPGSICCGWLDPANDVVGGVGEQACDVAAAAEIRERRPDLAVRAADAGDGMAGAAAVGLDELPAGAWAAGGQ